MNTKNETPKSRPKSKTNKVLGKLYCISLCMGLLLLGLQGAAQQEGHIPRGRIDSMQRQKLKDSLELSDAVIDQLWAVRDQYRQSTAQVYADTQLTDAARTARFATLRDETNAAVKTLLGETLYTRYLGLISQAQARREQTPPAGGLTGVAQ